MSAAAAYRRGIVSALDEERAYVDTLATEFDVFKRQFEGSQLRIRQLLQDLNEIVTAESETALCERIAELEEEALDG